MKSVAIVQSNYIPWKGYFDLIHNVDEFILFDDVQYTRRDWRNRNRIKAKDGLTWLSIPVATKGHYFQKIKDVKTTDNQWRARHWDTLRHAYAKTPFFRDHQERLEALYLGSDDEFLSQINRRFLQAILEALGVETRLSWSMDYGPMDGSKTELLLGLCQAAGAGRYLSGPAARDYLDEEAFQRAGIKLSYMDYDGYPEYPQLFPPFCHQVSVLDLLFCCGPAAADHIWGWRDGRSTISAEAATDAGSVAGKQEPLCSEEASTHGK